MGLFSLPESTQNQLFKQNSITDFAHPIYIRLSIICVYLFAMSFGLTTNFQNSKPLQLASSLGFSVVFICGSKKMHFPTLFSDMFLPYFIYHFVAYFIALLLKSRTLISANKLSCQFV